MVKPFLYFVSVIQKRTKKIFQYNFNTIFESKVWCGQLWIITKYLNMTPCHKFVYKRRDFLALKSRTKDED